MSLLIPKKPIDVLQRTGYGVTSHKIQYVHGELVNVYFEFKVIPHNNN